MPKSPTVAHHGRNEASPREDASGVGTLWWLLVVDGGLALVAGLLLLFRPDGNLAFVTVVLGTCLVLLGVIHIARAVLQSGPLADRALAAGVGVVAVAAGAIVIERPGTAATGIAVGAGLFLVVSGIAAGVAAVRSESTRPVEVARAILNLAAGLTIVVWPDVTVNVIAVLLGGFLIVRGGLEIGAGLTFRPRDRDQGVGGAETRSMTTRVV